MRTRESAQPGGRRRGLLFSTLLLTAISTGCQDSPTDPTQAADGLDLASNTVIHPDYFRPGFLIGASHQHMSRANSGYLFSVDPVDGTGTQIGPELPLAGLALAFNPLRGTLYASLNAEDSSWLARINPVTGAVQIVGPIRDDLGRAHQVKGMDFVVAAVDPSVANGTGPMRTHAQPFLAQRLFGITTEGLLVRIQTTTGEARVIGDLGLDLCDSTCYGATTGRDGTFYLLASCPLRSRIRLFSVDIHDASATQIAEWPLPVHSVGLSIGPRGELLAVLNESLYRIDTVSSSLTRIGDTGFWASSALAYVDQLARLCPCNAPGVNHGEYVTCVVRAADRLKRDGLITREEKPILIAEAARSFCGNRAAITTE